MSHLEEGLLHALLDGEIPSDELAPIQAHLAACAECRARLEAQRQWQGEADGLIELLEVPAGEAAPAGYAAPPRRRNWTLGLAWAASLAAALGLGYAARGLPRPDHAELTVRPAVPAESLGRVAANDQAADRQESLGKRAAANAPSDALASRDAAPPGAGGVALGGGAGAKPARERSKPPADAAEAVADRKAEKVVATSSRPDSNRPAAEPVAAPPAAATSGVAQSQTRPLGLQEVVRVDQGRANMVGSLSAAPATLAPPEPINLPDAVRRLNGTLRLIDGLVPLRLEAQGPYVRVIYRLGQGELVLSQQLIDGRVVYTLVAPPGFSADSLARLRARVRE